VRRWMAMASAAESERLAEFDRRFTSWIAPLIHDPVQRALSLAHGMEHWIKAYQAEFRGFGKLADERVAISARAGLHALHHRQYPLLSPSEFLDAIEIPSPISQADIDKAWVVESASSHDAAKILYPGTSPQEVLDRITREKADRG